MDYEKKYKDALDWMRHMYPILNNSAKEDAEHYFPELKESEDERIRKNLIELLLDTPAQDIINHHLELNNALAYLEKQKEQKPVQDNDEREYVRTLKSLISDFLRGKDEIDRGYYQKIYDWLDGRHIEQNPAEWSEEDEGLIDLAVAAVEDFYDERNPIRVEIINRLKSLRPQPHWKPSDEQMKALKIACTIREGERNYYLHTLFDDLEKL